MRWLDGITDSTYKLKGCLFTLKTGTAQCKGISDSVDTSLSKLQEMVKDREAWHAAVGGVAELDTA